MCNRHRSIPSSGFWPAQLDLNAVALLPPMPTNDAHPGCTSRMGIICLYERDPQRKLAIPALVLFLHRPGVHLASAKKLLQVGIAR